MMGFIMCWEMGFFSEENNVDGEKLDIERLIKRIDGEKELLFAFEPSAQTDELINFVVKKVKQAGKGSNYFFSYGYRYTYRYGIGICR